MLLYRYAEKKEVDNTQSTTIMTMHLCSVKKLHGASYSIIITTPGVTVFIRGIEITISRVSSLVTSYRHSSCKNKTQE